MGRANGNEPFPCKGEEGALRLFLFLAGDDATTVDPLGRGNTRNTGGNSSRRRSQKGGLKGSFTFYVIGCLIWSQQANWTIGFLL